MNSDINPEDILSMEVLKDASSTYLRFTWCERRYDYDEKGRTGDTVVDIMDMSVFLL